MMKSNIIILEILFSTGVPGEGVAEWHSKSANNKNLCNKHVFIFIISDLLYFYTLNFTIFYLKFSNLFISLMKNSIKQKNFNGLCEYRK